MNDLKQIPSRNSDITNDATRLSDFWDHRYEDFSLAESGIRGLGQDYTRLYYRCKELAYRALVKRMNVQPGDAFRILDAGCGPAFFASVAARHFPGMDYTGVDISGRLIQHLQRKEPGFRWQVADFCNPECSLQGPYDLIQSIDVMYLILEDANVVGAFRNFARWLKPGGLLLITDVLTNERLRPQDYIVFRPVSFYKELAARFNLSWEVTRRIYYFIPSRGFNRRPFRRLFQAMPPGFVFLLDRLALALGLPHWGTTQDSLMKMMLFRKGA